MDLTLPRLENLAMSNRWPNVPVPLRHPYGDTNLNHLIVRLSLQQLDRNLSNVKDQGTSILFN